MSTRSGNNFFVSNETDQKLYSALQETWTLLDGNKVKWSYDTNVAVGAMETIVKMLSDKRTRVRAPGFWQIGCFGSVWFDVVVIGGNYYRVCMAGAGDLRVELYAEVTRSNKHGCKLCNEKLGAKSKTFCSKQHKQLHNIMKTLA